MLGGGIVYDNTLDVVVRKAGNPGVDAVIDAVAVQLVE